MFSLFVALHIQELGGKEAAHGMASVAKFLEVLLKSPELSEFTHTLIVLDRRFDIPGFTALGNVYFIHNSLKGNVKLWNFHKSAFEALGTGVADLGEEDGRFAREKFATELYPHTKWTRKGYCYTLWMLDGAALDLVNVHLFHDASNLVAIRDSPSVYANNRNTALRYVHECAQRTCKDKAPLFVFGDMNFRLNLQGVLQCMSSEKPNKAIKYVEGKVARITLSSAEDDESPIIVEDKNFKCSLTGRFLEENGSKYRVYDIEAGNLTDILTELPVGFEPSYPYQETADKPRAFLNKRCPAWCDRVLMSNATKALIDTTTVDYDIMGRSVCMGDHKPVYLSVHVKRGDF